MKTMMKDPTPLIHSPVPAEPACPPHAVAGDGVCPACGAAEDPAMIALLSLDGARPVFCRCGGVVFAPERRVRRERVRTIGQAVDEAVRAHGARSPESTVYGVQVAPDCRGYMEVDVDPGDGWVVEIRAAHFSMPLCYLVPAEWSEPARLLDAEAAAKVAW